MNKMIITIGREFCSGGADIGHKIAEELGIPCYDKSILDKIADDLQMDKEIVKKYDERQNSIWRNVPGYQYGFSWYASDPTLSMPISERIANAQFNKIKELAEAGSCVIIGRCADYVLRERDDVINVFIRADLDKRIQRCMRNYNLDEYDAGKLIKRTDKIRASYYEAHTDSDWGNHDRIDFTVDSGRLGIEPTCGFIINAARFIAEHGRTEFK